MSEQKKIDDAELAKISGAVQGESRNPDLVDDNYHQVDPGEPTSHEDKAGQQNG